MADPLPHSEPPPAGGQHPAPPPTSIGPVPGTSPVLGDWWERLAAAGRRLPEPARWAVSGAVLAAAAAGVIALVIGRPGAPPPPIDLPLAGSPADPAAAEIVEVHVHAAGAVHQPGLYRLVEGARVADVIDAAGGPAEGADLDRLNLAARVGDGDRVYVPRVGEPAPAMVGGEAGGAVAGDGVVDLNTATAADLERLPGIGPATARSILDWRERHGPFRSVDQLLEVRGIGEAKLEALRDRVRV